MILNSAIKTVDKIKCLAIFKQNRIYVWDKACDNHLKVAQSNKDIYLLTTLQQYSQFYYCMQALGFDNNFSLMLVQMTGTSWTNIRNAIRELADTHTLPVLARLYNIPNAEYKYCFFYEKNFTWFSLPTHTSEIKAFDRIVFPVRTLASQTKLITAAEIHPSVYKILKDKIARPYQTDIVKLRNLLTRDLITWNLGGEGGGITPLAWAVSMENQEAAELLLQCGADVNAADISGITSSPIYNLLQENKTIAERYYAYNIELREKYKSAQLSNSECIETEKQLNAVLQIIFQKMSVDLKKLSTHEQVNLYYTLSILWEVLHERPFISKKIDRLSFFHEQIKHFFALREKLLADNMSFDYYFSDSLSNQLCFDIAKLIFPLEDPLMTVLSSARTKDRSSSWHSPSYRTEKAKLKRYELLQYYFIQEIAYQECKIQASHAANDEKAMEYHLLIKDETTRELQQIANAVESNKEALFLLPNHLPNFNQGFRWKNRFYYYDSLATEAIKRLKEGMEKIDNIWLDFESPAELEGNHYDLVAVSYPAHHAIDVEEIKKISQQHFNLPVLILLTDMQFTNEPATQLFVWGRPENSTSFQLTNLDISNFNDDHNRKIFHWVAYLFKNIQSHTILPAIDIPAELYFRIDARKAHIHRVQPLSMDILRIIAQRSPALNTLITYTQELNEVAISNSYHDQFRKLRDRLQQGDKTNEGTRARAAPIATLGQERFRDFWLNPTAISEAHKQRIVELTIELSANRGTIQVGEIIEAAAFLKTRNPKHGAIVVDCANALSHCLTEVLESQRFKDLAAALVAENANNQNNAPAKIPVDFTKLTADKLEKLQAQIHEELQEFTESNVLETKNYDQHNDELLGVAELKSDNLTPPRPLREIKLKPIVVPSSFTTGFIVKPYRLAHSKYMESNEFFFDELLVEKKWISTDPLQFLDQHHNIRAALSDKKTRKHLRYEMIRVICLYMKNNATEPLLLRRLIKVLSTNTYQYLHNKRCMLPIIQACISKINDNKLLAQLRRDLLSPQYKYLREHNLFSRFYSYEEGQRKKTSQSWAMIEGAIAHQMIDNAMRNKESINELCVKYPFILNFRKYAWHARKENTAYLEKVVKEQKNKPNNPKQSITQKENKKISRSNIQTIDDLLKSCMHVREYDAKQIIDYINNPNAFLNNAKLGMLLSTLQSRNYDYLRMLPKHGGGSRFYAFKDTESHTFKVQQTTRSWSMIIDVLRNKMIDNIMQNKGTLEEVAALFEQYSALKNPPRYFSTEPAHSLVHLKHPLVQRLLLWQQPKAMSTHCSSTVSKVQEEGNFYGNLIDPNFN